MKKYKSVTDQEYKRDDGNEYAIPAAPGPKAITHIYDKSPIVEVKKKRRATK